jgi:hypothetical protein
VKIAARARWTESDKKIKFYGFTEKAVASILAKFNIDVHVKHARALPRKGTWYHIVDPCNGRNWFMLWVLVDPTNTAWIAYEWPPVKDYVEGVGAMGPWVIDSKGNKLDGDEGPAQKPLGWGCERYRDEIHRIEEKLWLMQPRISECAGARNAQRSFSVRPAHRGAATHHGLRGGEPECDHGLAR